MRWLASTSMFALHVLVFVPFTACKSSGDDDPNTADGRSTTGPDQPGGSAGKAGAGDGDGEQPQGAGQSGRGDSGGSAQPKPDAGESGGSSGAGGEEPSSHDGGTVIDPTSLPQTPLTELPAVFASAICGALNDCLGDAKLRELTRREDCESAVGAELRAKDFAHMDSSVAAGRVLYDPTRLAECVDGITALGCDVLTHTFPEPCVAVLDGNVAIGGACVITADCEGPAFCAGSESCPSQCAELLGAGMGCSVDEQCQDGLGCIGGKCTAPAADGEECGGPSGKVCALGLNCKGATDTAIGTCVGNDEIQVGDEGDACEPGGTLCQDGLSCVYDGANGFHCEQAVDSGGVCHLGLPGQCPNDEYCDATEVTAQSTCRKLPGDGEACVLNGLCQGGMVCITDGDEHVCHVIADNGEDCVADDACRSGHCDEGKCEPPPACL